VNSLLDRAAINIFTGLLIMQKNTQIVVGIIVFVALANVLYLQRYSIVRLPIELTFKHRSPDSVEDKPTVVEIRNAVPAQTETSEETFTVVFTPVFPPKFSTQSWVLFNYSTGESGYLPKGA
jgi:hypothetical protein